MTRTAFSAVRREALSDSVYRQLAGKILHGELPPGDALPAERELSEVLGVNRGAVREAIKRLQQAGLVAVRQGGNSVVLDFQAEGGLELLPNLLVHKDGRLNATVVRSIMAMRSALAPDIAGAAAAKQRAGLADKLDAVLKRMHTDQAHSRQLQNHALEFWKILVAGGGNIAFRLAFNSMTKTYTQVWDVLTPVLEAEFRDFENLDAIAAAVRRGDAETAREAGRRHVEIGRQALERALDAVEARGGSL
ncbi:FadR family transcriptional regulator [Sinimarinibacterium sp. CAU 1509]|uniref:FadR/GntR family transcriptional regulator n=1 Tax=Sinimarinibacterium sp. CAU 1509 TaxID=2562283 RepID=UPI0010AD88C9|nr:GntR family transcriptional regulator [Sinimarinibacterium sp. CAU 1509]TJY64684.1 FadR family transcriptional regulator [Sinimarinibacterium sp. CAU 1509]